MRHEVPSTPGSSPPGLLAAAVIAAATALAYANGLQGPFVFDDVSSIERNASIRSLGTAWSPPSSGGETVGGRPLLNVSFALGHALGAGVFGHHLTNLLIHLGAALLLFDLVRRTLLRPGLAERFGREATTLALGIALVWSLHPLQTESVTYVVQRAESLAGLFALAAIAALARSADATRRATWLAISVATALLGVLTKEICVVLPLLALLYDRTFVAGSYRAAWSARRLYHAALFATWLPLAALVVASGDRGGSAGFGGGWPWSAHALTQAEAIVRYLRLAVWPHPLVFDHGPALAGPSLIEALPEIATIAILLAASGALVLRRPPLGYPLAWFWITLAPSSSVVPIALQPVAEHRMYLPLAGLVCAAMLLARRALGLRRTIAATVAVASLLAWTTSRRNADYRSAESLWRATVAAAPGNPRAWMSLGVVAFESGRTEEAIAHHERAIRLSPDDGILRANLATLLFAAGREAESLARFEEAIARSPESVRLRCEHASVLVASGRVEEGIRAAEGARTIAAGAPCVPATLGLAAMKQSRAEAAIAHLRESLRLDHAQPTVHANLGHALASIGRDQDARRHFLEALRLDPGQSLARSGLVRPSPASRRASLDSAASASFEERLR